MAFAWAGVGLGGTSLRACARLVARRFGRRASMLFALTAGLLTGYGVYLGRFIRLNTWDVLARPATVIVEVLAPLMHPLTHPTAWAVTSTFAAFFLVVYATDRATRAEVHLG